MKKIILPFVFAGVAFGATAGGMDEADTSDEMMAEAMEMAEPEVEESSGGWLGGWGIILILAAIAVAL